MRPFDVSVDRPSAGRAIVAVSGELDLYAAPDTREALDGALDEGATEVVVDLTDVDFIDSSGLACIVNVARRLGESGGRLVVVNRHPAVARTLQLTRLDRIFEVVGDRDEALGALDAS